MSEPAIVIDPDSITITLRSAVPGKAEARGELQERFDAVLHGLLGETDAGRALECIGSRVTPRAVVVVANARDVAHTLAAKAKRQTRDALTTEADRAHTAAVDALREAVRQAEPALLEYLRLRQLQTADLDAVKVTLPG
jgi:hypothetical protein